MTLALLQRLEFCYGKPGDYFCTNSIALDPGGVKYRIVIRRLPRAGLWIMDLSTSVGVRILSGGVLRDRTDVLLGVTTPGRPLGAIIVNDPKGRGDPGPAAFHTEGVGVFYMPGGFDPALFVKYETAVS